MSARHALGEAQAAFRALEHGDAESPGLLAVAQAYATLAIAEALVELGEDRPTLTAVAAPREIGWAHVELFGHGQVWGHVVEVEIANRRFFEITVPGPTGDVTHLYSPAAVFGLHPTTEEAVRDALRTWTRPLGTGHEGEHEGLPF